jgi:hypothetical protein
MTTNVQTTSSPVPEEISPYLKQLLSFASQLTGVSEGETFANFLKQAAPQYKGQEVAGTNEFLDRAFGNIKDMEPSSYLDQAGGLAGLASLGLQNIGSTYNQIQGLGPNFYTAPNQTVTAGNVNAPTLNKYQMTQPGNVTANTATAAKVTAPTGLNAFQMGPAQQVTAGKVSAPTGLNAFQMGNAQQVNAPTNLQAFQMQGPERVQTQDFTGANVGKYMDPYMQNVVQQQKNQAIQDYAEKLPQLGSAATAMGGLGGSRQALMAAKAQQGLQQNLANIQATGSQAAFQNAQQQFNQQQSANLQAAQANQQAGLTAAIQNLGSNKETQQLAAQLGMQAALANQQAGLTVGQQNLASQLATQQLRANLGMQSQQLNQAAGLQAALANQQAGLTVGQQNLASKLSTQQLGANLGMQAGLANQQASQQTSLANQQAALQAALANQQMGYNTGAQNLQSLLSTQQLGSGQAMQAALANQSSGLQAALANQQAGLQQNQLLAQYGLAGAQMAQQSQQFGANLGLQGLQAQLSAAGLLSSLGGQEYQQAAGINQALVNAGIMTQGIEQKAYDVARQNYMAQQQYPYQQLQFLSSLMNGAPRSTNSTTTTETPDPSALQKWTAGLMAVSGLANSWGGNWGNSGGGGNFFGSGWGD